MVADSKWQLCEILRYHDSGNRRKNLGKMYRFPKNFSAAMAMNLNYNFSIQQKKVPSF